MSLPQLVHYSAAADYRAHYERFYCRGTITTADGIRVYFRPTTFDHAFFESPNRDGTKELAISMDRATRIDWIKATLENPRSSLLAGWNKVTKTYDHARRVAVVYEQFVVVVSLSLKKDDSLKANFVTCYQATNSIGKINTSPAWDVKQCLASLGVT
jgi:hypothetical protein